MSDAASENPREPRHQHQRRAATAAVHLRLALRRKLPAQAGQQQQEEMAAVESGQRQEIQQRQDAGALLP